MSEYITDVLNPGVQADAIEGREVETVEGMLGEMDYDSEDPSYDADFDVEDDRYGSVDIDTDTGMLEVWDGGYGGGTDRQMMALGFEAESDAYDEVRQGVMTVDEHGASAVVYDDGEAVSNGMDRGFAQDVYRMVGRFWEELQTEEDAFLAELRDEEYTVELADDVAKQRDKMEGRQQDQFDTTLAKLAEDPDKAARRYLDGGRKVYTEVNSDLRAIAAVDDEDKEVLVTRVADHDELYG
jgi:mRNA-degrading endonuclease RelE of RelBE toxin-antitoxin system